jgi:hypothetical protein
MRVSDRIRALEAVLGRQREGAADPYAGETAAAAAEFNDRMTGMRERYLADRESYPPWENRSAAAKLATAETPEQLTEAKALLDSSLAQAKEDRRRCEEQIRQYQVTHRSSTRNRLTG